MRRFLKIASCIAAVCLMLSACGRIESNFDPEVEGIVDVSLQTAYGEKKSIEYCSLASGKRIRTISSFDADDMDVYSVPDGCLGSYIDRGENKVLNRIAKMELLDDDGDRVEIDADIEGIFSCLEKLEHELMTIRVMKINGNYFVYTELNVNLWTPCSLYYYIAKDTRLYELYEWDNQEVTGIRIRNMNLIQSY